MMTGEDRSAVSALAQKRGKEFESAIIKTAFNYERNRLLVLRKVDPPTVQFGGRLIRKRSPFLDFVGSWTERGGRALFLEAKSVNQGVLPIGDRGLKPEQWNSMRVWHWAGALTGIIWRHSTGVVWITYEDLRDKIDGGAVSFPARYGHSIACDWSTNTVDFLPILRRIEAGEKPGFNPVIEPGFALTHG